MPNDGLLIYLKFWNRFKEERELLKVTFKNQEDIRMPSIYKKLCLLSFLLLNPLTAAYIATPPKGWECIDDPAQLPQKIKEIYIGSKGDKTPFTPSLNVACEETSLSITEYMAQAKTHHEGDGSTRCTLIGKIETSLGSAKVLQIDRTTQWGEVRFIQGMLVLEGKAYVITATCLKKDFSLFSTPFFKAIQSFQKH